MKRPPRVHAGSRPVPSCGSANEPTAAGWSRALSGPISGLRRPVRHLATSCLTKSAKPFWRCVIPRNLRTCCQARSSRALPIRAVTSPRSPASTAFCGRRVSSSIVAAPSRPCPVSRRQAIGPLRPPSDLDLGHHPAAWADRRHVLLSLPHGGHLQPQDRRLGGL